LSDLGLQLRRQLRFERVQGVDLALVGEGAHAGHVLQRSFSVHSFIQSAFLHAFIPGSFSIHSFIHSAFVHSSIQGAFIQRLFIHSFIHSAFVHSSIQRLFI
jgi:hypothetical protein